MHLVNEGGAFYPLEYVSVCINSVYISTDTSYTGVYLGIEGCNRLFLLGYICLYISGAYYLHAYTNLVTTHTYQPYTRRICTTSNTRAGAAHPS